AYAAMTVALPKSLETEATQLPIGHPINVRDLRRKVNLRPSPTADLRHLPCLRVNLKSWPGSPKAAQSLTRRLPCTNPLDPSRSLGSQVFQSKFFSFIHLITPMGNNLSILNLDKIPLSAS